MGLWEDFTDNINDIIEDFTKNPINIINPVYYFGKKTFEAIGELTGANSLRGSLNDQRSAMLRYQEQQDKLFKDEQQRMLNQDLLDSQAAGAAQRRAIGATNNSGVGGSSNADSGFNAVDLYIGGR